MNRHSNNLINEEKCPVCKKIFITGYNPDKMRTCPSCERKFLSPVSSQGHGANNIHFREGCPALMSDGRFLTNYLSSNELTEKDKKSKGIKNHNQYRQYMTQNGDKMLDAERRNLMKYNTCNPTLCGCEGWKKKQHL